MNESSHLRMAQLADLPWSTTMRLAGSPWDALLELSDEPLARDVDRHWAQEREQLRKSRQLAERLGSLLPLEGVSAMPEDAGVSWRRALLDLRRDLFNGRPSATLRASRILRSGWVQNASRPELQLLEKAQRCARDLAVRAEQLSALEQRYVESRLEAQRRLQQRTASAPWLPAVALRSESAHQRLRRWCAAELAPGSKPYRQAVLTAIGYFSRTVAKTSPRSRFTVVTLPETPRDGSELRLSVAYFRAFVELLLSELDDTLPTVRANPTLHEHEGRWHWLCWENGKELSRSGLPGDTPRALLEAALQPHSLEELAAELRAASQQERQLLRAAVRELLRVGALLPVLAASPEDPDFPSLLAASTQRTDRGASRAHALVHQVSRTLEVLRARDVDFSSMQRLTEPLDATRSGRTEDVLFENTFEANSIEGDATFSVVRDLMRALGHLPPLAHARWRVGQALLQQFGARNRIPLLPCVPNVTAAVRHRTGEWERYPLSIPYRGLVSDQEIELSPETLRACRADSELSGHPVPTFAVWAAYVQLAAERAPTLNRLTPGFGARTARFLREVDYEVERLRERAKQLSERAIAAGIRLAEVRCAFWNSANQAPPLFESFVDLPFVRPAPWQRPIALRELEIEYGPELPFPRLVDRRSNQEIVPIWLGLERWSRSPLLGALQAFAPTSWEHPWYPLLRDINHRCCPVPIHEQQQTTCFPRIQFDGRLTLQRRSWWIPGSELAFLDRRSEFAAWLELRALRRSLDLPEAVFVQSYDPERAPREGKPQLILLDTPLFMEVLKRIRHKSAHGLIVSECEPEPCPGQRACELLLELELRP